MTTKRQKELSKKIKSAIKNKKVLVGISPVKKKKKVRQHLGKPCHDEVNPCIVWHLNREFDKGSSLDDGWILKRIAELRGTEIPESHIDRIQRNFDEFIRKYDTAYQAALKAGGTILLPEGEFVPLVYRLDVNTSEEVDLSKDDLKRDKFGGLPDLRSEVFSYCIREQNDHDHRTKYYGKKGERPGVKSLAQGLAAEWPKCACCGTYMRFISQLNYSEWRDTIHLATKCVEEGWYSELSAMGCSRDTDILGGNETHLFFYCPCNQFDNPNSDSAIVRLYRSSSISTMLDELEEAEIASGVERVRPPRPKRDYQPPYTEKQYKDAVVRFMKKHGIHPSKNEDEMAGIIPLQFVEGYTLSFELDWVGYGLRDASEAVEKALGESTKRVNYSLFGAPRSQQEPKRFMNPRGYEKPMRQAPLLSWNDNEHDFTYQMYGDFRTAERFGPPIFCKYDGSCT